VLAMEKKTIDRRTRPTRQASATRKHVLAVDFPFDDQAAPSAAEIAAVSGILPELLRELLASAETPEEN
jgi:hypothetical protein